MLMTRTFDGSGATLLHSVPARAEPGVDDAPLGTVSIEADGVGPRPGDDPGRPRRDLVVRGADFGTPGQTILGDTVPAPKSSGVVGPGVVRLLLPATPVLCSSLST
jgi:hypothetical protein